jgi:hypothetical protein
MEATTMNDTTNTHYLKACSSGENCKHPHGPHLTIDDFYFRQNGVRYPNCKECHKAQTKLQRVLPRDESGNSGELLVINKLRSLGVYAAPGKSSEFKWLDVVAWGCVRIEVKTATLNSQGAFHFGMGDKREKEKERSDFVILVCIDIPLSYHVFPSNHAVFYHSDGRAKKSVQYAPEASHHKKPNSLDNETMARYMNRWYPIETRRREISAEMFESYAAPDGIEGQAQPARVIIEDDNAQQMNLL